MRTALQPASHSTPPKEKKYDPKDFQPPRGTRLITDAELALKGVEGLDLRYRRHWPENFIDECVARVKKAKKKWCLLTVGGDVADPYAASHVAMRMNLAVDQAMKYAKDPSLWGVHCSLPPAPHSEELFNDPMTKLQFEQQRALFDEYVWAYPKQYIILAGGPKDIPSMKKLINYCVSEIGDRFIYKMNAMSAKLSLTWEGTTILKYAVQRGANIGFEMLGGTNESRVGGNVAAVRKKIAEVEKMAGKKFLFEAWYKPDLRSI